MSPYTSFILTLVILGWTITGITSFEGLWKVADTGGWKVFIGIISGPAAWAVLLYRWVDDLSEQAMDGSGLWNGFGW
jgi:hypothetical protein